MLRRRRTASTTTTTTTITTTTTTTPAHTSPAAAATRAAPTAAAAAAATKARVRGRQGWPPLAALAQLAAPVCLACILSLHPAGLPSTCPADNGSGGDESAAVKRPRMRQDSSSGEGSGAGPGGEGGEDGATAMDEGGPEAMDDAAGAAALPSRPGAHPGAPPAAAAPAGQPPPPQQQQQRQRQQQQQQGEQHAAKDPSKLHSPPSSTALVEDGAGPHAAKRTRNP